LEFFANLPKKWNRFRHFQRQFFSVERFRTLRHWWKRYTNLNFIHSNFIHSFPVLWPGCGLNVIPDLYMSSQKHRRSHFKIWIIFKKM
jgi:hypothetical protein